MSTAEAEAEFCTNSELPTFGHQTRRCLHRYEHDSRHQASQRHCLRIVLCLMAS